MEFYEPNPPPFISLCLSVMPCPFSPLLSSRFLCPVRQCCGIWININSLWTKCKLFISFHHINCMGDFPFVSVFFFLSSGAFEKPKCVSFSTPQIRRQTKNHEMRGRQKKIILKRIWPKQTLNTFYLYLLCIICNELRLCRVDSRECAHHTHHHQTTYIFQTLEHLCMGMWIIRNTHTHALAHKKSRSVLFLAAIQFNFGFIG